VWYLTIAVTLPPAYAFLAPIPLAAYRQYRAEGGTMYRRVFSNATISLAYGAAAVAFHSVPPSVAGPGHGPHALNWAGLAGCCGVLAWIINNGLLLEGIRLADPGERARVRNLFGNRQAIRSDFVELSLGVTLALVVAINPVFMVLGDSRESRLTCGKAVSVTGPYPRIP
jgi:hypothetical protein